MNQLLNYYGGGRGGSDSSSFGSLARRSEIADTPLTTSLTKPGVALACPKCGTFKKSGRVTCCAPGGAWYKNCGGAGNKDVDHSWLEGVEACKCKFTVDGCSRHMFFPDLLVTFVAFFSRVDNYSPHTNISRLDDDHRFFVPHMWHHQEIRQTQLLRSWRFLVRKLRGYC